MHTPETPPDAGRSRTFWPRFSALVARPVTTAGHVSARVPERLERVSGIPDPIRDSETPSRPSRMPIAFYLLGTAWGSWDDPRLGAKLAMPSPNAGEPRGQFDQDAERDNTPRPAAGAYVDSLGSWPTPAFDATAAVPGA